MFNSLRPKADDNYNHSKVKLIIAGCLVVVGLFALLICLTLQQRATICRLSKLEVEILELKQKLVNIDDNDLGIDNIVEDASNSHRMIREEEATVKVQLLKKNELEECFKLMKSHCGVAYEKEVTVLGKTGLEIGQVVPTPTTLDDDLIANSRQPVEESSTTPTNNTELGLFFYPNPPTPNYMIFENNFQLTQRFKIALKIKPKNPSGVILAVGGDNQDGMILQMINGTIKITVSVSGSTFSCTFVKQPDELCDGSWHTIQVSKTKNVLTLAVDDLFALPSIGQIKSVSKDSSYALYFGGLPSSLFSSTVGLETKEPFMGCVKDFHPQGPASTLMNLGVGRVVGNIQINSCPIDA